MRTISKFNEKEALRKKIREEQAAKNPVAAPDSDDEAGSSDEFANEEDEGTFESRMARQGGVGGAQMKVTARNLRIREDTAKYLRNLDPNSAFYDPKSRSMRDDPNPEIAQDDKQFAGDNFARVTGGAVDLADTQVRIWGDEGGRGRKRGARAKERERSVELRNSRANSAF